MSRALSTCALALVLAACGGGTEGLAVVVSTQETITPGPNRLLVTIASAEDATLIADPATPTTARFLREGEEVATVETTWVWAIPDVRGFFAVDVDLPSSGRWELVLEPEGGSPTPPTPFGVQPDSTVPSIGDPAPAVATPTFPETPLELLTSASEPDPALHALSLDTALSNGRPTVVAFATPAYCTTASCGPTLDVVESVMGGHPDVDFIHVEVFDLEGARSGSLDPVEATLAWGLPSEPWVFVVSTDGVVSARFEGALGADELERALAAVG